MSATIEMPDFEELASLLWFLGALQSPSLLQGYLAGLVAVGENVEAEEWLPMAGKIVEAVDQPSGDNARLLVALHTATIAQLEGGEIDLELVLPDDAVGLVERTRCLGQWCQGFLAGFAYGGKQRQQVSGKTEQQYSKDVAEALSDLAAISQISVEEEEVAEGQESDYFEVAEYVRLAAINIFLDCHQGSAQGNQASPGKVDPLSEAIGSASQLFNKKLH